MCVLFVFCGVCGGMTLSVILMAMMLANALSEVVLNPSMVDSYRRMTVHTSRGQFGCLDHNLSGERDMLTFALTLNNTGSEVRYYHPYNLYYAILDGPTVALSGNMTVDFIRDSKCRKSPLKFYYADLRKTSSGLSGNCIFHLPTGMDCLWIDITNLTLKAYNIVLSIEPLVDPFIPPPNALHSEIDFTFLRHFTLGGLHEVIILMIIFGGSVLFLGLYMPILYACKKPTKSTDKSKIQ